MRLGLVRAENNSGLVSKKIENYLETLSVKTGDMTLFFVG